MRTQWRLLTEHLHRNIWKMVTSNVPPYLLRSSEIVFPKYCSMNDWHVKGNTFYMSKNLLKGLIAFFRNLIRLIHRPFQSRASEAAMIFLKNGDAFGRMFGYLNWVAKVFPEISDYRMLRASAERFHECIKVNDRSRCTNTSNSITKNLNWNRSLLMNSIEHTIQNMNVISSICI